MNSKRGIMKSYMAQRPDKHGACTVAVYYALSDEQCEKPSSYQVISLVLGSFIAHLSSGQTPMLMQDSLLGQRSPASVEVELLGRNVERHIIGTPTGKCLLTTNWAGLDNGKLSCGDVQGIDVRGEAGEGLLRAIRSAQTVSIWTDVDDTKNISTAKHTGSGC